MLDIEVSATSRCNMIPRVLHMKLVIFIGREVKVIKQVKHAPPFYCVAPVRHVVRQGFIAVRDRVIYKHFNLEPPRSGAIDQLARHTIRPFSHAPSQVEPESVRSNLDRTSSQVARCGVETDGQGRLDNYRWMNCVEEDKK